MEQIKEEILVKSEKKSQKKKICFVWIITAIVFVATVVFFIVDYSNYKQGQEFGLSFIGGSDGAYWLNENDSYAEQCRDSYNKLNQRTSNLTFNGVTIDMSGVREAEINLRSSFANIMELAGYDRYSSYTIADWFKYTNAAEYFYGYYWSTILPISFFIVFVFSIIFTIFTNNEAKKEIVVYEDSVLCRMNPKKSKQLVFNDISNVSFGTHSLKLVGLGVKFKLSHITNAEDIKSVIIEKKNSSQSKANDVNISSVDELRKYKELLDSGVITQEEFESKKKQLL